MTIKDSEYMLNNIFIFKWLDLLVPTIKKHNSSMFKVSIAI